MNKYSNRIPSLKENWEGKITVYNRLKTEFENTNKETISPASFNLIEKLHIDSFNKQKRMFENAHTRVLGALLVFNNNIFLWSFLERCNISIKNRAKKKTINVSIERQYQKENGTWAKKQLNDQKEKPDNLCRPDCLIWKEGTFAIIIENKINGASETPRQVNNYIEAVSSDHEIWGDNNRPEDVLKNIWVIYLGGDSEDMPSDNSLSLNNLNNPLFLKTNKEAGKHLSLISYKNYILPWLEEDVLPNCPFGMTGMTGGLLVYIDYLKSRFENIVSKDNLLWGSDDVVGFIEDNGGCSYDEYKAISSYIGKTEDGSKDDYLDLFKAIRHYYLNNHFRFINQLLCLHSRVSLEDSLGTAASIYAPRRLQLDRATPGSVERPAPL